MKRIIKILALIMTLAACLSATSCARGYDLDGEDKNWAFVMASNDKTGEVEYASIEYKQLYLQSTNGLEEIDAKTASLGFKASEGRFTLTDKKMQMQYHGTYTLESKSSDGANYKITLDYEGEIFNGSATVSEAKLHDDTKEYSLILVIDGMTVYFKSVQ